MQALDYKQKEIEHLFRIASYQKEIAGRKLASQMILTLGEECDREKVIRILAGDYQGAMVQRAQLERENLAVDGFSVMENKGRISVVVSDTVGEKAEVYAEYGSQDGILAIGKETFQTTEGTVYELDVADAEEFQVIVYRYPVEYEAERITENNF